MTVRNYLVGLSLLLFMSSCQKKEIDVSRKDKSFLIEFEEFEKIAKHNKVKIIDFRKPEEYKLDHIAGAINIWRSDIRSTSFPYSGMMASRLEVEALFQKKGIRQGDLLVIYDDKGLCDAARLWWMLQIYGYDNIRMLHGSYSTWKKQNKASTEIPATKPSKFRFQNQLSLQYFTGKEEIREVLGEKLILDTRTEDEFHGKRQKKGASKAGHIPGAIQIDWANAVNYHGDRRFKPVEELKDIYKDVLAHSEDTIITYCHSGTRSAHTTFVLTQLLGMKNVKNYDGSWIEWSYFNDLPFEKDSITTIFE